MTPLLFLHISRTGGTSLIGYLDRKMVPFGICTAHEIFEFEALEREGRLQGYGFYRGHFGINFPERLGRSCRLITFLRSPIPRFFSSWRRMRTATPSFGPEESPTARRIHSLRDLACSLEFTEFCERLLSERRLGLLNSMTVLLGRGRGWNAHEQLPIGDELLERAKRAIDQFEFVGFTETFDASVDALQRHFGWETEPIAHVNSAPEAAFPADPGFRERLMNAARFDLALYDYARERFGAAPSEPLLHSN